MFIIMAKLHVYHLQKDGRNELKLKLEIDLKLFSPGRWETAKNAAAL